MFTRFFAVISVLLFSTIVFADTTNTSAVTDPSKSITVTQSTPQFIVKLAANPTTGYKWMVGRYNTNLITVVGHEYTASQPQMPGSGGIDTWTFKVNSPAFSAPHMLKVRMIYARPWNMKDQAKMQVFSVVTGS